MAASGARNHDYHLVDPSPWPVLGAIAAFALALGVVAGFHGHGHLWSVPGLLIVLYTMISWWRDDICDAEHEGLHTPVVPLHLRSGPALFTPTVVMFFVARFWVIGLSPRRDIVCLYVLFSAV